MKRLTCTILLLHCLASGLPAATYYVQNASGSDANPGTFAQPWKTIQFGIDQVQGGDTVFVLGGIYGQKISFSQSGSPGARITLYGDPANRPVISGAGQSPNGREGMISIDSHAYIEVNGFEIRDFATASANTPLGILITGAAHHLRILNCEVHHIAHFAVSNEEGANGIGVYGTDPNTAIHELLVSGCEVRDCNTLASEAFVLNGNVRNFQILDNTVHDCDNIAFDFIGWEGECAGCTGSSGPNADRARQGIVRGNAAYNIDTKDNPNPDYNGERSAAGFYVDGGSHITFEQNRAYNCNFGFELASEHFGKATDSIIVRNNLVYNNQVLGIATGGYDGGNGPGGGSAENCVVVNNTFYNNHTSTRPEDDFGGEIYLQHRNIGNVYKNNVVYAAAGHPRVNVDGGQNTGNSFGTNLYFGSTEGSTQGQVVAADPLFLNAGAGDFRLDSSSPAVNVGENLGAYLIGTEDYGGSPRLVGNVVDLGAYETSDSTVALPDPLLPGADMRLWPVPLQDLCWLQADPARPVESMEWLDAAGRRIRAHHFLRAPGLYQIETSYLPEGAYWLRIAAGDDMQTIISVVKR